MVAKLWRGRSGKEKVCRQTGQHRTIDPYLSLSRPAVREIGFEVKANFSVDGLIVSDRGARPSGIDCQSALLRRSDRAHRDPSQVHRCCVRLWASYRMLS